MSLEVFDSVQNLSQVSSNKKVWSSTLKVKIPPNKSVKGNIDFSSANFASVPFLSTCVSVQGTALSVNHSFECITQNNCILHLQNLDVMNEQNCSVVIKAEVL